MRIRSIISLLGCALFLLWGISISFAGDELVPAPQGKINSNSEKTEEGGSWITIQYIGSAPGMDEYRWADDDFGWTHTFNPECKDIHDVTLAIMAWDVDYAAGERDAVYGDGIFLGYLEGSNQAWHRTEFDIPVELLGDAQLEVWLDIDAFDSSWAVTIDYSRLRTHWDCVPPVAAFTAAPTYGIGPMNVCFTDLSTCANAWLWEFGDGATSTDQNPCHIYDSGKKYYTVKLTAWGPGGEDSITKTDYITVNEAVIANFRLTSLVGPVLEIINLTSGNANHFLWEISQGDVVVDRLMQRGDFMNRINPEWRYPGDILFKGNFTIMLTAWGNGGMDKKIMPNAFYYDPDNESLCLGLLDGGETYPGEGWDKLIDNRPETCVSSVNEPGEPWGIFNICNEDEREIRYFRYLANCCEVENPKTNVVRKFEVTLMDQDMAEVAVVMATSLADCDEWEIVLLNEPVVAEYIKIKLLEPRGDGGPKKIPPKYIQMCEFQAFGGPVSMDKRVAASASDLPTSFALDQNYPNPFNPSTAIQFQLPEVSDVELVVFNLQGQLVKTLAKSQMNAGTHSVVWDATDMNGMPVAGGVYIYKIQARGESEVMNVTRKMIFMK